ncbi:MAG: nitrilase-related carbon-nitrogen hydrolase [Sumerlaeia bacterium]
MKILLNQFNPEWENTPANLEKLRAQKNLVLSIAPELIVLPEMFNSGFSMAASQIAESITGPTLKFLQAYAQDCSAQILAGLALKRGEQRITNSAVFIDAYGKLLSVYDKIHPFTYAGESAHYAAGENSCIVNIHGISCAVFICYDLRFPELFRAVAKQVEVIFVIANWPEARVEHWFTLLKARAIENQCYVVGLNRTGTDGNGLHYQNSTAVFDSLGKSVEITWHSHEIGTVEIDAATVQKTRTDLPFLQDFRGL